MPTPTLRCGKFFLFSPKSFIVLSFMNFVHSMRLVFIHMDVLLLVDKTVLSLVNNLVCLSKINGPCMYEPISVSWFYMQTFPQLIIGLTVRECKATHFECLGITSYLLIKTIIT